MPYEVAAGGEPKTRYTVYCHNYSDAIIFDLRAYPEVGPRNGSATRPTLDPGESFSATFWGPEGGGMKHAVTFYDLKRQQWRLHDSGTLDLVDALAATTLHASE